MKVITLGLFLVLVVIGCVAYSQQPTKDLSPTESETDKIQLKMKDMTIMQMAYQVKSKELDQLNANFASTQADLDTLVAKVKKAHGWGEDVTFDKTTSTFVRVAKSEPSKDAPKK